MINQNKVLRYLTEFRWMIDNSQDDVLYDFERKALKELQHVLRTTKCGDNLSTNILQ